MIYHLSFRARVYGCFQFSDENFRNLMCILARSLSLSLRPLRTNDNHCRGADEEHDEEGENRLK